METTNLLNYYNDSNKNYVEVIGYLYDKSTPIQFKNNTKLNNNLEFYCLKLFAVKQGNDWKLTKGFIKVAINKTELGSIVRLKGVLSKATNQEDTRVLNLVKFKKDNNNWNIEPIKPQKVNHNSFKIDVMLEYQTFYSIPICYNEDAKLTNTPLDMDDRKAIVYCKNINSDTALDKNKQLINSPFVPFIYNEPNIPSLYLRLIKEINQFNRLVLSIGRLNELYVNSVPQAIIWKISLKGYSKLPNKERNFCYIKDGLIIESLPYIELQNVIL